MRDDIYLEGIETRFQKGQSGNLKGRPKGSRGKAKRIRQVLGVSTKADNQLKKETVTLSIEELITITIVAKALKGNTAAYRAIMDNAYGKL
ncbi:DUF5681 domain-containing protein [Spirosoma radiotolerans]|uniref:DUF5681 domain-containing protein n=1 Tax=Spirosoma radiotolerans TaxID=1379870 RepID=A0A0E3ZTD8_9BACT|nr:DUF5681 domain-containing protein [Spirosoma radiotolerans]AKD53790.1 hypothetical protein SD10_01610 [Spirosoma radiotolerans]